MPNYNPETNLPFGVVHQNDLDQDVVDDIYCLAVAAVTAQLDECDDIIDFEEPEEPCAVITYEGIRIQTSYLGGALHLFSLNGPIVEGDGWCSPCIPGAVNVSKPGNNGGPECHGFPDDWFWTDDEENNQ